MDELNELKKKYNEGLKRNLKAEEYLKAHTITECEKEIKIKGIGIKKNTFDVFNEVVKNLSELMFKIEDITGREMTDDEKFNGFSL